jgi:hypothetical protein
VDELDLEHGIPERGEEPRRRRRSTTSESAKDKPNGDKLDKELYARLIGAFDQLAEWRAARDDAELANAFDEDKDKMARGLTSFTHAITPARKPLIIFLSFVEPVLAFGRIGRILAERFVARRQRIAEERAAAQAEWEAAQDGTNYQPIPQVP